MAALRLQPDQTSTGSNGKTARRQFALSVRSNPQAEPTDTSPTREKALTLFPLIENHEAGH
ncbi:hypothetical protein [Rhodoflexus caldus]|uniref:hypothetical protein n=1 Tax=Rhodoflexus caldus TaxID=2891236 RepID=UPI00202A8043|nr:hypothetical protein [Rhodoflexus caldus]